MLCQRSLKSSSSRQEKVFVKILDRFGNLAKAASGAAFTILNFWHNNCIDVPPGTVWRRFLKKHCAAICQAFFAVSREVQSAEERRTVNASSTNRTSGSPTTPAVCIVCLRSSEVANL